jgi:hypothetical protein
MSLFIPRLFNTEKPIIMSLLHFLLFLTWWYWCRSIGLYTIYKIFQYWCIIAVQVPVITTSDWTARWFISFCALWIGLWQCPFSIFFLRIIFSHDSAIKPNISITLSVCNYHYGFIMHLWKRWLQILAHALASSQNVQKLKAINWK